MKIHKGWFKPEEGKGRKIDWLILGLLLIGFSYCTLNPPEKTIVLNLAAQNSGFLLAQEKPELAQEILKYSEWVIDKDFTENRFHDWTEMLIASLKLDPFLQMNFKELIKLVNIKIELNKADEELVKLLYSVIQNFVIGIEAGNRQVTSKLTVN